MSQPATAGGRPSILVVDDDPVFRSVLQILLEHWGHEAMTAHDMLTAVSLLSLHTFRLVIATYQMPGLDGFDLLDVVRRKFPTTPVILLSSDTSAGLSQEAYRRGAFEWIPKPYELERLKTTVATALGG